MSQSNADWDTVTQQRKVQNPMTCSKTISSDVLPKVWVFSNFEHICDYIQRGKGPKYSEKNEFPVVNQKAIRWHGIEEKYLKFVDESQWDSWDADRFIKEGDILWNSTGTGTIGRACYLTRHEACKAKVVDSHVTIVRTNKFICSKFVFYWIMHPDVQTKVLGLYTGSTNQVELSKAIVLATEIPLPPLAEQQQIATKLDELLAQVDVIKTRLDTIPKILKRFRQSVLAAAMSGELTESWRGGISIKNWEVKKLEDICTSIADGDHQAPPREKQGIPFLVISNVSKGKIEFGKIERWVPEEYYRSLKHIRKPQKNDILYTVTGSFGIPVIVETNDDFCFQRHIAILKPNHEAVNYKFLYIALSSINAFKQAEAVATGTAQKTVPLKGLRNFVFDFPQLEEQTEIVTQVEQLFAFADQVEQRVKDAHKRVNHLTQSILAKAFSGELTADWRAQNPDLISGENSAEALLAKIKVEREALAKNKPTKPRTIKKTGESMKPKNIMPIIEALKAAGQPLSSQDLLAQAGYPGDADTDQLETFFLDIREQLNAKTITRERKGDKEFFAIAE